MRRLSNTFLKINMILSIVFIVLWAFLSVMFFVMAGLKDVLQAAFESNGAQFEGDPEAALLIMQAMFITFGVLFLFFAAFAIPSAIISSKARNAKSNGVFIAAIIFSALSFTEFGIAGGILGMIATKKEARSNIIDAE